MPPYRRELHRVLGACVAALVAAATFGAVQAPLGSRSERVIVSETSPASAAAETAVERLGGRVTRSLPLIGGFAAEVPEGSIPALRRAQSVAVVTPDIEVGTLGDDDAETYDKYDSLPVDNSWRSVIGVDRVANRLTGEGVGVAVIDTGVADTEGLASERLTRVDFTPDHDGFDYYGHGTHMAGLIAGVGDNDDDAPVGVAPHASLISVKVAGVNGATDVSAVISAIQWVVTNRDRFGIRVLNLSFGTDSTQSHLIDPLNHAVQRAAAAGILVVAAAGNSGPAEGTVDKPGDDPAALTVGAARLDGTLDKADDTIPPFSGREGGKPDVVAPGVSIVSLRAPDSLVDQLRPQARVGDDHFKGTGTSQSAAIVSGIAALMFEANPSLTSRAAKDLLIATAQPDLAGEPGAGAGMIDAAEAIVAAEHLSTQTTAPAAPEGSGAGSIEASRGSSHAFADLDGDGEPEEVRGEVDVLGNAWDAYTFSTTAWDERAWSQSAWDALISAVTDNDPIATPSRSWGGMSLTREGWSAKDWSAKDWSATDWSAKDWSAKDWSAKDWSASIWN